MISIRTLVLLLSAGALIPSMGAQQSSVAEDPDQPAQVAAIPDAPSPAQSSPAKDPPVASTTSAEGKQTQRILWIIPNFRSVSADEKLPPLAVHEKFKLTIEDSFDYSSFIYVGALAGLGDLERSYPEFRTGAPAYARYYWHTFADTVDGNLMTEFLVPVATREDPRYYTMGHGGFVKRTGYSVGRLFVTRTDRGGSAPNFSEIVGNGAAAGISSFYYPSQERTWTKTGQRWVTQIGLDGVSNLIKEFWPDVNAKLFHNKY